MGRQPLKREVAMIISYNKPTDYIIDHLRADGIACKCCGLVNIDHRFLYHRGELRKEWGSPLTMNSICRCPAYNITEDVGGHKNSLHQTTNKKHGCNTCGADVNVYGWFAARKKDFAKLALSTGWSVGLAENFIHIDRRTEVIKYKQTTFFYGSPPSWYGN